MPEYILEPVVKAQNLSKIFTTDNHHIVALDDVSFEIYLGETVGIVGSSGSGKSTLMTIMGLLDAPSGGHYWLDGHNVNELDSVRQARTRNAKVGFVFRSFYLIPRLSVLKNVQLPLLYGRLTHAAREKMTHQALVAVGMETLAHARPRDLSLDQRYRVALARAIVGNPSLVIIDNPTEVLDPCASADMLTLLRSLSREYGFATVIFSHTPAIEQYVDRVIRLPSRHAPGAYPGPALIPGTQHPSERVAVTPPVVPVACS